MPRDDLHKEIANTFFPVFWDGLDSEKKMTANKPKGIGIGIGVWDASI